MAETAAYLRVAADEVLRMIAAEGLPARQFGKEWRFLKSALQSWLSVPASRKRGLLGQLGTIKGDPFLQELLDDTYARRGRPETSEG
jgi:excisionase family DNA binding protein